MKKVVYDYAKAEATLVDLTEEEVAEFENEPEPTPQPPSKDERLEFVERDYAMILYDSMVKDERISELEKMNAEMLYMIMAGGM